MTQTPTPIHETVREHYAERIKSSASCCGSDNSCDTSSNLYPIDLLTTVPSDVASTSYGCGDPITLASLKPGQTVLDLGSAQDSIASSPHKKSVRQGTLSVWT